jgi:pyridoxine 5-phosphate synthase
VVAELKSLACRVSLFADVGCDVTAAAATGADRIELYTGPYAEAHAAGDAAAVLGACAETARAAHAAGLGLNAGHDLSQDNLGDLLAAVPGVQEVSIGHALMGEALYDGLATTVARYLAIMAAARA